MVDILIVDDEDYIRDTIKTFMENEGYKVTTASSAKEAVSYLNKNNYHIVITDLNMHNNKYAGIKVLETAKKNKRLTQVIILTGCADIETAKMGIDYRAFKYVEKNANNSIEAYQIIEIVKNAMINRQKERYPGDCFGFIDALGEAIDLNDPYTQGHSKRVAIITQKMAEIIGMNEDKQSDAYLAGIIHDIGKVAIDTAVLNKSTVLNYAEFAMIKAHPEMGKMVIEKIPQLKHLIEAVYQHHERYDGITDPSERYSGYPGKAKGDEINQYAQFIAVADTFDAMTSNRSYRSFITKEQKKSAINNALNVIKLNSGKQFHPKAVEAFFLIEGFVRNLFEEEAQ